MSRTLEKLLQSFSRFLRVFLKHPMSGVFQHYYGGVCRDQLTLLPQRFSQRLLAANGQHRHRQLSLRELREILGGLQE